MSPTSAIIMLSCIYWGALFGGAITSILFNIPGEPWSVATTFDGYPMAQKGQRRPGADGGVHLVVRRRASSRCVMITFLAPLVAKFALKFGPPEFFAVYLLTFCSFVGMGKGSPFKILASMAIGFALAAVGMDTVTGQLRLTFGIPELMRGFDFLIARDRPVRHRRNPAVDGRRPGLLRQGGQDQPEGRAGDLEAAAALLGDLGAQRAGRHLDGHHARRRDAGLVHELRPRQEDVARTAPSSAPARSKA